MEVLGNNAGMIETSLFVAAIGSLAILLVSLLIGSKAGQAIERRYQTANHGYVAPIWVQAACGVISVAIGFGLAYLLI